MLAAAPGGNEEALEAAASAEWDETKKPGCITTPLEEEAASLVLTEAEAEQKRALLAEGFGGWSKRDYRALIAALERLGREAKDAVVAEVAEATSKPPAEVAAYYTVFFIKGPDTLAEWAKIQDRIAKVGPWGGVGIMLSVPPRVASPPGPPPPPNRARSSASGGRRRRCCCPPRCSPSRTRCGR